MMNNILVGLLLIIITSMVHTSATFLTLKLLQAKHRTTTIVRRLIHIDAIILTVLTATIIEAILWAFAYISIGAFDEMATSLYFSLVTYTTLGYGDLVLHDSYRLLSAFQAANGVLIFGWSTALVVAGIQKVYTK